MGLISPGGAGAPSATDDLRGCFERHMAKRPGRTAQLYACTLRRVLDYDPRAGLRLSEVDRGWLEGFDRFLSRTAPSRNARNIHLRNLRAVFNAALDDGVITNYPFHKFQIRNERTRKRALTAAQVRAVAEAPLPRSLARHRDMFVLSFLLVGINIGDLCLLRGVEGGRVEFARKKTGRLYSVRVEPEAEEIIARHRGERYLLDVMDTNADYRSYYKHFAAALRSLPAALPPEAGVTELTSYWARHSWATIAASLDIPKETIAHALGHGCDTVTDIYIDFDRAKVDQANRRVIDWVYYGKDWREEGTHG